MPDTPSRQPPAPAPDTPAQTRCRWLAEAFGTAFLTLTCLWADRLAELGYLSPVAAFTLTPALVVTALIYTLSDVSGAHFNPAVTLAFALRGSFPWARVPLYLSAQLLGALAAAWLVRASSGLPHPAEHVGTAGAFGLETLCALLLVMVILGTAGRLATVAPTAGLVVGAVLALDHFLADPLSAVSMNPARFLAPALFTGDWAPGWPHVVAPFVGAALAAGLTFSLRGRVGRQDQKAANGEPQG